MTGCASGSKTGYYMIEITNLLLLLFLQFTILSILLYAETNVDLIIHYKPKHLVTCNLFSRLSSTYISLAESDFHLPCILRTLSGIKFVLLRTAAVIPPDLKL